MASCGYCKTTTFFSSHKRNGLTFCSEDCMVLDAYKEVARQLPQEFVEQKVQETHQGNCPQCGGPGPVDVHTSHRVYSVLIMTSWSSPVQLSCRSCAIKAKLGNTLFSGVLGWWGFPWGIVMTPVQVGRNLVGLVSGPAADKPSQQLRNHVTIQLGHATVQALKAQQAAADD
jgi:endogenous inhibitor of DNA gyrase (YacG/DUF329 family)